VFRPAGMPATRPSVLGSEPIVVNRWGGMMTINGVQVTQEDQSVRGGCPNSC
jgi:hypothetical protein